MVLFNGQKLACAACIKGHRSSACNHTARPLFTIRSKGRPVSQCDHCRERRKTQHVHVKCECGDAGNNNANSSNLGVLGEEGDVSGDGVSLIVARKGARKVKTLEPATAAYPNGIQDILDGAQALTNLGGAVSVSTNTDSTQKKDASSPSCQCGKGGKCKCLTPRYTPKKNQDGPSSKKPPPISLTIPSSTNAGGYYDSSSGLSPGGHSPQITVTPVGMDAYNQHPHQHHALDGHHIGGSQNDHHSKHAGHYTPYSPSHHGHHRSHHHGSPGSGSPSPSPNSPSALSMLASPVSAGPHSGSASALLAPPDMYALQTSLLNISSATSMGIEINRPRSASALSAYTGTGPATPVESYFSNGMDQSSSWMMAPSSSNEGVGGGYGANSAGSASPLNPRDMMLLNLYSPGSQDASNGQLQPQRQTPGPASPYQSDIHLSSSPYNTNDNSNQSMFDNQLAGMTAQGAAVVPDFGGSATSDDGHGGDCEDEGDADDQVIRRASRDLLSPPHHGYGHRRRGSHSSIASSSNGGCGVEIRLMSASPVPPTLPAIQTSPSHRSPGSMMVQGMQLMGLNGSGGGCGAQGQPGCHCWSATGSPLEEAARCRKENCPCCQHLPSSSPSANRSSNDHYPYGLSPQTVPPGMARSRSSSSASHNSGYSLGSASEASSTMAPASFSLERANSTGALRQGSHGGSGGQKYKPIRPKPSDSLPAVHVTADHRQQPHHGHAHRPNSLPTSTNASGVTTPSVMLPSKPNNDNSDGPFSSPTRASFNSEGNVSPCHQSSDGGFGLQSPVEVMDVYDQLNLSEGNYNSNGASSMGDMFSTSYPDTSPINNGNFSIPDFSSSPFTAFAQGASPQAQSSSSHSRTQSHSSILSSPSSVSSVSTSFFPSRHQDTFQSSSTPVFSQGHGRSRSFADTTTSSLLLEEPRPIAYSNGHGRSTSASFLHPRDATALSPIELIVTPASPFFLPSSSS
ncbi:hypothetical protein FRB96_000853 [Tulasnella sp. 330]|nr:hypothetical protein FRB96_000853 [Tulasnella sp. 330]KAG8883545.1 hypothetical protein FRB97_006392 [Tulasnella sp. 331]KAG8889113.1 hypothetical protein FRB98_005728 [Tulasnella sp. 332]